MMMADKFDIEEYEDDLSEIEVLVDDIEADSGCLSDAEDARYLKGKMKCIIESAKKLIEQCEALSEKV
jgi:hypothetical protein